MLLFILKVMCLQALDEVFPIDLIYHVNHALLTIAIEDKRCRPTLYHLQ